MHWVEMLPDTQTPSWLGLPSNAERVLLTTQGTLQLILFIIIICSMVFCHIDRTITCLDASSSLHLFRFHVSRRPIINHLSLYSSVFAVILTGRLNAARDHDLILLRLLWAEYCVCVWWQDCVLAVLGSHLYFTISFLWYCK